MYLAPTFGEVAFWVTVLIVSTILLIRGLVLADSTVQIEDLEAWQHNYERTNHHNR